MKREFPDTPLVGVGAIIIEGPRVVLVKRAHPPLQAQWSIPGGVLEVGEMMREAAVREVRIFAQSLEAARASAEKEARLRNAAQSLWTPEADAAIDVLRINPAGSPTEQQRPRQLDR